MNKDNIVYLEDILKAINKIDDYIKDVSYETFLEEPMRQDAIIRHLEIIGEAATRISKDFLVQNPHFPIKEAVSMRNFLIHGYDQVDVNVVWKTIQNDIPFLKNQLAALKLSVKD
ncbi:MAG: DUF86 domain-containing protein [bacterium]|nr:DUF86 domain-containing protein [bacterium]